MNLYPILFKKLCVNSCVRLFSSMTVTLNKKKIIAVFLFGVFVLIFVQYLFAIKAKIVKIPQGYLAGSEGVSRNGFKYFSFRGVPYAKPPIGVLRFLDPQNPDPWQGTWQATQYGNNCLQVGWSSKGSSIITGDEDCLYLNIFSPQLDGNPKLPVLVWIHGGSFLMDSGSVYAPDYFMDHPLVVVTINYRIGALGFLHIDDQLLPGNYGMKDQVAALRWVKRNIEAFGGDPERVTIAGSSAGGASVNWHMYSSLSKGLFHGAISQSGTALGIWAETPRRIAKDRGTAFATLVGCNYQLMEETVKCLKNLSADEFIKTQKKYSLWSYHPMSFAIVAEYSSNPFVNESAWQTNPIDPSIPWMLGFTFDEGGLDITGLKSNQGSGLLELNDKYQTLFPILFMYNTHSTLHLYSEVRQVTEKIRKFYFGTRSINLDTAQSAKEMWADAYTTYDHTEAAMRYRGPKYFYIYDHLNEHSYTELVINGSKSTGPVHCDDLISLFKTKYFPHDLNYFDGQVSEMMVTLWTNFITTGNPNSENLMFQWNPITSKRLEYLHINDQPQMRTSYWLDRYFFWKSLNLHSAEDSRH